MTIIKVFSLFAALSLGAACYQKSTNSNAKPTGSPTASSPIVEKTLESNVQPSKDGDINAAMDFYRAKNYEKAAAKFEEVVKSDQKNHAAHLHLGRSYQALKKGDQAINSYKKAIEIKPEDAEANYELGKIYLDNKNFQASLPYVEKAAKIKYTSTDYLIALGDNYRELKKCDYAVVPYGKVMGFDDKNTAAYYGMGLCYIELKNRIAAGQQVRNLEKLDPNLAKKLADQIPK